MDTPKAKIVHQTPGRLRIKIPSRRGDESYFSEVYNGFSRTKRVDQVEINPVSASILCLGEDLDPNSIQEYAESKGFFTFGKTEEELDFLPRKVVRPMGALSSQMMKETGGRMNLLGIAFMSAVSIGLYQVLRGNLKLPTWHTALWYAFGLALQIVPKPNFDFNKKDR